MENLFISNVKNLSRQSHAKVKIECSSKISEKCKNINEISYRDAMNTIERNNGKYLCLYCSRHLKYYGINNPNNKYQFDHNIMNNIDSEEKAYLLGWIASNGHIGKKNWKIHLKIHKKDLKCLEILKNIICKKLPIIINYNDNSVKFVIYSKQICNDICNLLKIERGKKSHTVNFPELNNDELTWIFLRGYFEGYGTIKNKNKKYPECSITSNSIIMLNGISNFCKIPHNRINNIDITFYKVNCIDFLGKLYNNIDNNLFLERKYNLFQYWLSWKPIISGKFTGTYLNTCKVYKTDKNAILPSKKNISDVGYDLTIIKEVKKLNKNTILYDTGLKINIDYGYYTEIVPRSSLSKSGWILSNSIGIIDLSYNGNLFIALTKIEPDAPDLQLPFRCCQLIIRQQIHINMIEVAEDFEETVRNTGGFGSTNNKKSI